ncbi:hypothetical protein [Roseivirga thermotolerans]|uniref:hypothetical protein n=1 Tax=Roseivirga thermotolerans TaxID=1758176 RepID=UPI00273D7485|nr:hypothetical protein [Roseivirga thermotolerans]
MNKLSSIYYLLLPTVVLLACGKQETVTLYLSNESLYDYDKAFVKVRVDGELLVSDSLNNQYISSHWEEYQLKIPVRETLIEVEINSNNQQIKKDTVFTPSKVSSIFGTFSFDPLESKYNNDEIYKYLEPGRTVNFTVFADSLYSAGVLVLKDTLPDKSHITLLLK